MSSNARGQKTQIEILDSAWDLISERGADVSISQIAKAVGISRQTIYMHFGSRGGLLVALVRRADQRYDIKEKFADALKLPEPEERLIATLRCWLEFVPVIYPVAKDLIRLRGVDSEAAEAWEDRMSELRSWLLEFTQSLRQNGVLKEHWTPEKAANFFWAQSSVQVWGLLVFDCGWAQEQVAEKMQYALIAGLLKDG